MLVASVLALLMTLIFGGFLHGFSPDLRAERPNLFVALLGGVLILSGMFYYALAPALNPSFWAWLWLPIAVVLGILWAWNTTYHVDDSLLKFFARVALLSCLGFMPFFLSSTFFHAKGYASLAGQVESRIWAQDTQPANVNDVRLVTREGAQWSASQRLGAAPGAIGSQFEINEEAIHLQMIRGKLWWIAPLDFRDLFTWFSSRTSPGYIMVDAENPTAQPVMKLGYELRYTPQAGFNYNLGRHLWRNGFATVGLIDGVLEIDEQDRPWWVVGIYELTIGTSGDRMTGILIVDPATGTTLRYTMQQIPAWVDLAVPADLVEHNLDYRGRYMRGWLNGTFGRAGLTQAITPRFVIGTDHEPYWVSTITSTNDNDTSMLGLMYTQAQTGRSHYYHVTGGTEQAVLDRINNTVSFRHLHGQDPMYYNVRGTMAAIVPLMGESHTFQAVAVVNVENLQQVIAQGATAAEALRAYEGILAVENGQANGIEATATQTSLTGRVQRISAVSLTTGESVYYFLLVGNSTLFTGTATLSSELVLTREGDEVDIRFAPNAQGATPLSAFDNRSLTIRP